MKKRVSASIAVILVLFIAAILYGCAKPVSLVGGDYNTVYERIIPNLSVNAEGKFEILQLTDLHLMSGKTKNDLKTIGAVEKLLDAKKYDLVVISGDLFEGFNSKSSYDKAGAITAFATLFENKNQYWVSLQVIMTESFAEVTRTFF